MTATPAQLERLVSIVISRAGAEPGLSVGAAVQRLLSSADTWELPAFRTALLKALVDAAKSRGAFVVLSTCPAAWLSKGARTALLDAAYAVDKDASTETQVAIRTWLARLAAAQVYGPLTDAKVVKKLLKSATSPELADATLALVHLAYQHIAKSAARDPAALLATLDEATKSNKSFKDPTDVRSRAVALLLDDIVASGGVERFSADVKSKLSELEAVARTALAPVVQSALAAPAANAEVFRSWRSLVRFASWLGAPVSDNTGAALLSSIVRTRDAELAVVAFDLSASAEPEAVLAAFIVLRATFPDTALDTAFASYAKALTSEAFTAALTAASSLVASEREAEAEGALRAVSLLLSAPVEGSGRAIATLLHPLLLSLEGAMRSSVGVIAQALAVLSALVDDRTGLLRAPDGALILAAIGAALVPSAHRAPACAPHLVPAALSPLITLVRHRADIALAHLPALVGVLAAFFPLLQRKRGARAKGTRKPFWLAIEPRDNNPAAAHAALLARAFTNLATAKLPTTGDAPARTLAGPLAKHAPALLVAYARAAADPWAGLSTAVRRELEPGLFSLCDIVTAGGRADGRGREGEGVGAPFGLGDGAGGAAEHEIWADTWRAWSRKRYTGQG